MSEQLLSTSAARRPSSIDELSHWLALLQIPQVGPVTCLRLLEHFHTPAAVLQANADSLRDAGVPETIIRSLQQPDWQAVEADLAWLERDSARAILTYHDPRYPALLKEIADAPPLLFIQGDVDCLARIQVAIVGSRNPSASGEQHAHDFASALVEAGAVVTSGLALGIDACAHKGALAAGGQTIAVMGNGLDRVYPARHRELAYKICANGAVISEFPAGTTPKRENFPRRNRIISGLALGTLVIEAARRSGSLISARLAAEQGREVFALPGSIHNPLARGCHELIRQGAKLVEIIEHITEELGPLLAVVSDPAGKSNNGVELSAAQQDLLNMMGYEPCPVDMLIQRSGLTAEVVSSMLLTLELQGIVESLPGGSYSRRQ
jgi:DNA processing protein